MLTESKNLGRAAVPAVGPAAGGSRMLLIPCACLNFYTRRRWHGGGFNAL